MLNIGDKTASDPSGDLLDRKSFGELQKNNFLSAEKNCQKRSMTTFDRISDLPRDIKDNILVRLPVKEAVRTCCLSSKWKFAWTSIPELVVDNKLISYINAFKIIEFVDMFLSLHDGSIRKFVFSGVKPSNEALDRWMGVLLSKGIEEIQIRFSYLGGYNGDEGWKVPSTFYDFRGLKEVELEGCIIELPRAFKGFKLLKSLSLNCFTISEGDLANLISSCPLLEIVRICGEMQDLVLSINAPMLKELSLNCWNIKHVCLRTPSLVKTRLILDTRLLHHCEKNLTDLLDSLLNIETLELFGRVMRYLALGNDLELSVRFYHLKMLRIVMEFPCQKQAAVARQLLHCAPNLQELYMEDTMLWDPVLDAYAIETDAWAQDTVFQHLKFVEIDCGKYKCVFMLVKFLLASAPLLEKLVLKYRGFWGGIEYNIENSGLLEKLVQCKKASKSVKIVSDLEDLGSKSPGTYWSI